MAIWATACSFAASSKQPKVNVNFDDALASEYEVLSAPTFIAFDKGEEIGRLTGKTTLDALLKLFEGKIN